MSINYYPQNPPKLRSPLLDNVLKNKLEKKENKETVDDTLDQTLFNKKSQSKKLKEIKPEIINQSFIVKTGKITSLETVFKIASAFITSVGGTFCLLELINIVRIIQSGSFSFGNSILFFVVALMCTIVANVICAGFIHLVKAIKYIYLSVERQNKIINNITTSS